MKLSLIVQNVPAAFTAGEIWERVAYRRWGVVENIELLPAKFVNQYTEMRDVLIHMYDWFDENEYKTLMAGKYIMLYYSGALFWRTYIHNTRQAQHGYRPADRRNTYSSRQVPPHPYEQSRPKTYSDVAPGPFLRTNAGHRSDMREYKRSSAAPEDRDVFGRDIRPSHTRDRRGADARDRRGADARDIRTADSLDEVCFEMSRMTIHRPDEEEREEDNSTIDTKEQEESFGRDLDEVDEKPVSIDYGVVHVPKRTRRPVSSKKGK